MNTQEAIQQIRKAERGDHGTRDMLVTPAMAKCLVEHLNFDEQRALKGTNVVVLAAAMKEGRFREYSDIQFASLNGALHLINGQHTLHAIVASGVSVPLCVHVYSVRSADEIRRLYSRFDVGTPRNLKDTMGSLGAELELTTKQRDRLSGAVKRVHLRFRTHFGHDQERAILSRDYDRIKEMMREWKPYALEYFKAISGAVAENRKVFERGDVLGVGMITFKYQSVMAHDFWSAAAQDDGLRQKDPRKTLIEWLKSNRTSAKAGRQHKAAIAAWNAFMDGKTLERIYTDTDKAKVIVGCNFVCDN